MFKSDKMRKLIENTISTKEFWKINYYLLCLKKAPHGGVFCNKYPNMFLKHYRVLTWQYFMPDEVIPIVVLDSIKFFIKIIEKEQIDIEEILRYCLGVDPNDLNNPKNGKRLYIASSGKVIFSSAYSGDTGSSSSLSNQFKNISDVLEGKSSFLSNFNIDYDLLIVLFIFTIIEESAYIIQNINEIISYEKLTLNPNKYGLSDVTNAEFRRQGFVLNDRYYLYNVFFDTSIGGQIANYPKTIKITKSVNPSLQIFMRCDDNLSVPRSNNVGTASIDFQKWRGITLNFNDINTQLRKGKETIVHFDPETCHKILVYIKLGSDADGTEFYHLNVEQLWNPEKVDKSETIIITNYVHAIYYPNIKTFEHVDFSVNQYFRDVYEKKYYDAEASTGVSIKQYGDFHYKIWCVRCDNITTDIWANLVCFSLDEPFRNIFMETFKEKYSEN